MSFPGRPGVWGQFSQKEQYVQKEGSVKSYGISWAPPQKPVIFKIKRPSGIYVSIIQMIPKYYSNLQAD